MRLIDRFPPFDEKAVITHAGMTHLVFKGGDGPGVLLMHELPGMVPEFWRLAHWLVEAGYTVWAPDLFTETETPSKPSLAGMTFRACISREIHLFARNHSSPVTQWLRALSRELHTAAGGPGVGVIGMCMSGNFALTLAVDPWVVAPVASQPSLPVGQSQRSHSSLHMSSEEQDALKARDIDVMGLRFEGDPLCRAAKFTAIRTLIGENRFSEHVLPDSAQNPKGNPSPHAVLTKDLIDEDDTLTKQKLGEVIGFLKERLIPRSA